MLKFMGRKLLSSLVLLFIGTAVTFSLIVLNGEGIAKQILGESATPEQVAQRATELGLDRPFYEQYWLWLSAASRGDLGRSFYTGQPVTEMMASRIPVTLSIVLVSVVLMVVLAALLGVTAAVRGGATDNLLQVGGVIGAAIPNFVIAIVLVLVFAIAFPILPATGFVPLAEDPVGWTRSIILPVVAVLVASVAAAAQQFRGAMIDTINQDYIRTLRTRGLSEGALIYRHALRNAAMPGLTTISLQTIGLIGGVVIIERIFALPGIAAQLSTSSFQRDIPVVMGAVLFTIVVVVVVNIALDLVSGWLNPKVRLS